MMIGLNPRGPVIPVPVLSLSFLAFSYSTHSFQWLKLVPYMGTPFSPQMNFFPKAMRLNSMGSHTAAMTAFEHCKAAFA